MLSAIFNLIWGWFGVATLIGLGAIAVVIFSGWIETILPPLLAYPATKLRHYAILVAIAAFSFTAISGRYYNEGIRFKQAQWDDAKAKALKTGNDARSGAERSVDDGVRDPRDSDQ